MGEGLKEPFDAFYQRFLLRDLFGKVMPGLLVLFTLGIVSSDVVSVSDLIKSLSVGGWILAIGIGWFAGFGVQSFGEWSRLILYFPMKHLILEYVAPQTREAWKVWFPQIQKLNDDKIELQARLSKMCFESQFEFYQYWGPIISACDENSRRGIERVVVIKEACGNGYVALLITFFILMLSQFFKVWPHPTLLLTVPNVAGLMLLLGSALLLGRMHFVHVDRQQTFSATHVEKNLWRHKSKAD